MAKTRVSELAKEYGMTSKELLAHLQEMKIPAKTPSSALEDAYVNMARKKLAPILETRAAEIEAARLAEEQAAKEAEEEAKRQAELERIEAERRREEERRREKERLEAEAAQRAKEEAARLEAERLAAKEAERTRVKDTAPKSVPSLSGLLDQIASQEKLMEQHKQQEREAKREQELRQEQAAEKKPARKSDRGRELEFTEQTERSSKHLPIEQERPSESNWQRTNKRSRDNDRSQGALSEKGQERRGKGRKSRRENQDEDRYRIMAREAELYIREQVLEEARVAVEEASLESTGRRKRRKERRKQQAAEAAERAAVEQAIANDQDLSMLDVIKVPQNSTVAELAKLLDVSANDIIKRLFLLGTPLTMTQSMSDELIELVADDLGRKIQVMTKEEENSFTFYDDPADLKPRAPIVTVMGHVDHGKTSLLDAIRHTGVAAGEAGGITQAIGASQVKIDGRPITFIDTPGHETFTAMRARGAKVTDIVILIVAADDGVMPQTVESIDHARAADVPIVVAVNKCDREDANPERVRQALTEYDVIPEEWGGKNMFVNISAKQNQGIDDLLETVLLQADVLELKANPDTFASGYVLESKLDKGRGSVATVLVMRGTLRVGDALVAGLAHGRVRAMFDQHGNQVSEAGPADAVEILGLSSLPGAGDEFRVFQDERDARDLAEQRSLKARIEEQNKVKHITLENLFESMENAETKELNLVIKADVVGSIEALEDALAKMDQSEVRLNVIHSAVGAISETDVTLADASNAIIIGFGVRPEAKARAAADRASVQIRSYSVIYKAIEDIDAARIGMLKPTEEERTTGTAEVRETFKVPKVGVAAGCMVVEGEIHRDDKVRLVRDGIVVYEGSFASMRRFKEDVKSVRSGYECGLGLENFQDFHIGDLMECYTIVEVARTE